MTECADYFKTFCKISKALGASLGMQEILQLILDSSIHTMNGKAACLFLADEEQDVFVPVAQKGLSENYLHAGPMRAKRVVDNILEGGHLSIYDATADERLENLEAKRQEGIASILVVPVRVRDKTIGVLSLYTAEPREFSPDEIEFQSALAEQGGMAIERTRLIDRLNQNSELFFNLASEINSSLDVKKIMHILTAEVGDALGMKGMSIRLWNADTKTLDLIASYGLSEEYLAKGPISADKGVGLALKGETVVIEDVETDHRVFYREAAIKEGIKSILCVPIRSLDETIGIMKLCSPVKQKFPQDTIRLIEAVGHQGGLAITNASAYLKLEDDKNTLEKEIWSHRSWF